jgi:hypothetical protein
VEDLDRIFDRDDVLPAGAVDVTEHRSEGGRLADAGRARDEDQAAVLLCEVPHTLREAKVIEGRNFVRDRPEGEGDVAALPEGVDAEAWKACLLVGGVELTGLVEAGESCGSGRTDRLEDALELGRAERRPALEQAKRSVVPNDRRLANL